MSFHKQTHKNKTFIVEKDDISGKYIRVLPKYATTEFVLELLGKLKKVE